MSEFESLLEEVRACRVCEAELPEGPRPVVAAQPEARVLIVGQAPGRRVHASGTAWDDPSGDRLRDWLRVGREEFYDPRRFALVPMGFCYPGTGRSGDLPPRPECAPLWHERLLAGMPRLGLTLLLGRHAQDRYLPERRKESLTARVSAWRELDRSVLPLPHPSPRNNLWLSRNPWFEAELLPVLRRRVRKALGS